LIIVYENGKGDDCVLEGLRSREREEVREEDNLHGMVTIVKKRKQVTPVVD
jgi:hypothetical protein